MTRRTKRKLSKWSSIAVAVLFSVLGIVPFVDAALSDAGSPWSLSRHQQ